MYQLNQKLHTKIAVLSTEYPFEHALIRYFGIVAIVIVCAYLYFVSMSVLNVMAEREAQQSASSLESNLGILESKYFELAHAITPDKAKVLGLSELAVNTFVYRLDTVGVAASAHNAI